MTEQERVVAAAKADPAYAESIFLDGTSPYIDPDYDPHAEHAASGIADQDCARCERQWEYYNRGGAW